MGANLAQLLAAINRTLLFHIFLDLHKSYDAIYSYIFLEVIHGYGVRPTILGILGEYLACQRIFPKAGGWFRP